MMPAGIDEAGRGAWAGPICAVIIGFLGKLSTFGVQIRDSKLLSEKQREIAAEVIQKEALCGIGIVSHTFIDTYGIQEANRECFRAALRDLTSRTGVGSGLHIKIDGREICSMPYSYEYIVDGDALDEHIAAASIVAKVTRDRLMREFDKEYPQYLFQKNKGYGTQEHRRALTAYGPCPIHRMSYAPLKALSSSSDVIQ